MAMKAETPVEKINRLLGRYESVIHVLETHLRRFTDAASRLDTLSGNLAMYRHHPTVDDDLRKLVDDTIAPEFLAAYVRAVLQALQDNPMPVKNKPITEDAGTGNGTVEDAASVVGDDFEYETGDDVDPAAESYAAEAETVAV